MLLDDSSLINIFMMSSHLFCILLSASLLHLSVSVLLSVFSNTENLNTVKFKIKLSSFTYFYFSLVRAGSTVV